MNVRVLLVDDDEDNTAIVERMLRPKGFEVHVARTGPEALAALAEGRPDVILLDVLMPTMSGMEVLDRIRASPQHADIPIILVTAKATDDDLLMGYKFGADYYIPKPFSARQLLSGIALVLGRDILE